MHLIYNYKFSLHSAKFVFVVVEKKMKNDYNDLEWKYGNAGWNKEQYRVLNNK